MALTKKEQVGYDSDMMSAELDKISLDKQQYTKGLLRLIICSAIGIFAFFVSVPHNGENEIVFSIIYNAFLGLFGNVAYWLITVIVAGNLICHVYFKYVKKGQLQSAFAKVYDSDSVVHTFLYTLGFLYVLLYALKVTVPGFQDQRLLSEILQEEV